jgi:hypothetical protein
VAGSWRLLSVSLLSFSSGLPLGLVWIAIPTWMARVGVDIKVIGLFALAQAPVGVLLLAGWRIGTGTTRLAPAPDGPTYRSD